MQVAAFAFMVLTFMVVASLVTLEEVIAQLEVSMFGLALVDAFPSFKEVVVITVKGATELDPFSMCLLN